ncbi:MAG: 2,3,4,5-tetrahydropyridine-2,6-dicarboxylate N-succinyltransferase [Gammaproteobacteria bacterium]
MSELNAIIETAYADPSNITATTKTAVREVIELLNAGKFRLAEKHDDQWQVNTWLKKAILLYFKLQQSEIIDAGYTTYFDKVPLKYTMDNPQAITEDKVRVVPTACIRKGAYVAPNCVVMPSFINIGAYVGSGTMVDTWATVGSCAQIGQNVHLSGGVGIGGVLEPLQANPTIIEDNCFIGARSEIVEGVVVETGAVISMGVFIGQSTRIYDRETGKISYGRVPAYSVVVPGNLPSDDGKYSLYCAVIVKRVDEKTRAKVGINELLRL